jgi:hypothetical protein
VTDHNPYLPPVAAVADDRRGTQLPPKPWAVTIVQVLGALCALLFAIAIARNFYGIWEWSRIGVRMSITPNNTGLRIALLVVLLLMLIQLPRRSQIGRWCGAALLLAFFSAMTHLAFTTYPSNGEAGAEAAEFILGYLLCSVPTVWLLYAFAFSRKARAYFGSPARN